MKHAILFAAGLLAASSLAAAPACYPADIGGAGSFAVVGETQLDRFAGWKCPAQNSVDQVYVLFVGHKKNALITPGIAGKSLFGALDAYATANVKKDVFASEFDQGRKTLLTYLKYVPDPIWVEPTAQRVLTSKEKPSPKFVRNPAGVLTPVWTKEHNINYAPDVNPTQNSLIKGAK